MADHNKSVEADTDRYSSEFDLLLGNQSMDELISIQLKKSNLDQYNLPDILYPIPRLLFEDYSAGMGNSPLYINMPGVLHVKAIRKMLKYKT